MGDLFEQAVKAAVERELTAHADAQRETYQAVERRGVALMAAVASGKELAPLVRAELAQLLEAYVAEQTWQRGFGTVPGPPWCEVGPRLREVDALIATVGARLGEAACAGMRDHVENATRLRFHSDHRLVSVRAALARGEVVRIPPRLPITVSLGPTSWSADQGPIPPKKLFVRLGQGDPTVLLMIRQDRAGNPTRLELLAEVAGRFEPVACKLHQAFTPVEGLHEVTGESRFAGWHFAVLVHAAMFSVELTDLDSPHGVYVQVPL